MSAKHTPGPWEASETTKGWGAVHEPRGGVIAWCPTTHVVSEVEERAHINARLIAAAPDLLEALRGCIDVMLSRGVLTDPEHPDRIALAAARAAIAKATQP